MGVERESPNDAHGYAPVYASDKWLLEEARDLHYMHYNFCRIHKTLRVTPVMEEG
jgi:hypothetical protein